MKGLYRTIDVNINRCREALRVLEDIARFVISNPNWTSRFRNFRHSLAVLTSNISDKLIIERNVEDDFGSKFYANAKTICKEEIKGINQAILSNFKRLQEALRSLEEIFKLSDFQKSKLAQKLRFQSYVLEQDFSSNFNYRKLYQKTLLYVIIGEEVLKPNFERIILHLIKGGADIIQLRLKNVDDQKLLKIARTVKNIIEDKAIFLLNDRADLAYLCEADGVHLGKSDLSIPDARKILGNFKIIGKTLHTFQEIKKTLKEKPNYISVGTIFKSPTKPQLPPRGFRVLKKLMEVSEIPIFAIGGINKDNVREVITCTGCKRIVVSSYILQQKNILKATKELKDYLNSLDEQQSKK